MAVSIRNQSPFAPIGSILTAARTVNEGLVLISITQGPALCSTSTGRHVQPTGGAPVSRAATATYEGGSAIAVTSQEPVDKATRSVSQVALSRSRNRPKVTSNSLTG